MPLGQRDLTIIINARDNASVVLNRVGRSMQNTGDQGYRLIRMGALLGQSGTVFLALGAAITAGLGASVKAAADFESQIRRAATQVSSSVGTMASVIPGLKDAVKEVAEGIGVPIEQLTDGMFEVLSTVEATIPQAKAILDTLSKAAVAGGVPLNTVIRAVLGTMNGLNLEMKDMIPVLDTFFQLVRKGGSVTLEEFTNVIGRSLPTMGRYGQSIKEIGTLFSFLTKNAMPAANAAVSMARATVAIFHPDTIERLKKMGILVEDLATRKLRPLPEILLEIGDAARKLPPVEQIKLITDLLKASGGTIQAKRLIELSISDPEGLKQAIADMEQAKGVFEETYAIMADSPDNQLQIFRNNVRLLGIELGATFLPLVGRVVGVVRALTHAFANLPSGVKAAIAIGIAITGVFGLLMGTALLTMGAIVGIAGSMVLLATATGLSVGAIAAIILPLFLVLGAALLALSTLIVAVIIKWEDWKPQIYGILQAVAGYVQDFISVVQAIASAIIHIFHLVGEGILFVMKNMSRAFAFYGKLLQKVPDFFPGSDKIKEAGKLWEQVPGQIEKAGVVLDAFGNIAQQSISKAGEAVRDFVNRAPLQIIEFGDKVKSSIQDVAAQFKALQEVVDDFDLEGVAPDLGEAAKEKADTIPKVRAFVSLVTSTMIEELERQRQRVLDEAAIMFDLAAARNLYGAVQDTGRSMGEGFAMAMAESIRDASPLVADALDDLVRKMEDFRHDLRSAGLDSLKLFPDREEESRELVRSTSYTLDQLIASLREGYTAASEAASEGARKLRAVTKADMMAQMQETLNATILWHNTLLALGPRLGPAGLQMLGQLGLLAPEMQPHLAALNSMTDQELGTWVAGVQQNFDLVNAVATSTTQTAFGGLVATIREDLAPAMGEWANSMVPAINTLDLMTLRVQELNKSIATLDDTQIAQLFRSGGFADMINYLQGRQTGGPIMGGMQGTYNGRPIGEVFGGNTINLNFGPGADSATVDYAAATFVEVVRTLQSR